MRESPKSGVFNPSPSRRALLSWGASLIAMMAVSGEAFAQPVQLTPAVAQFLALSQILTAYAFLDETIARRTYDALCIENPANVKAFAQLATMAENAADASALQAMARKAGLEGAIAELLNAWYTGTVSGPGSTVMIAYRDALMYRPTADGLTVPTYCNKGPMWWQDTLPPGLSRIPANNPEVL